MAKRKQRFTVDAGRLICMDGKPFITINRPVTGSDQPDATSPCAADEVTWVIAALLNNLGDKEIVTKYLDGYVSHLSRLGTGMNRIKR